MLDSRPICVHCTYMLRPLQAVGASRKADAAAVNMDASKRCILEQHAKRPTWLMPNDISETLASLYTADIKLSAMH